MANRKIPHPVDLHVGNRIRLRRMMMAMSQEKLADALGITFQQVQKYEKGTNRTSASRLVETARALQCPVGFFFEELPEVTAGATGGISEKLEELTKFAASADGVRLNRAFSAIQSAKVRRGLIDFAVELAPAETREAAHA